MKFGLFPMCLEGFDVIQSSVTKALGTCDDPDRVLNLVLWTRWCRAALCWNYAGRPKRTAIFCGHAITPAQGAAVHGLT
eukprot:1948848-Karenia_brevis.AAC.1